MKRLQVVWILDHFSNKFLKILLLGVLLREPCGGWIKFTETYHKPLTDIKQAVDIVVDEEDPEIRKQNAAEFLDLYEGMLIWMKPDKTFETKEEGDVRKKNFIMRSGGKQ